VADLHTIERIRSLEIDNNDLRDRLERERAAASVEIDILKAELAEAGRRIVALSAIRREEKQSSVPAGKDVGLGLPLIPVGIHPPYCSCSYPLPCPDAPGLPAAQATVMMISLPRSPEALAAAYAHMSPDERSRATLASGAFYPPFAKVTEGGTVSAADQTLDAPPELVHLRRLVEQRRGHHDDIPVPVRLGDLRAIVGEAK
jgi:hypothetical protein